MISLYYFYTDFAGKFGSVQLASKFVTKCVDQRLLQNTTALIKT